LLNADKQKLLFILTEMNFKYIAIVAVIAVTLVATTAITADSAFATKYREKNQALTQTNDCGNGFLPENVFCQNHASQVQGDENIVILAGAQESG
jgi:hypothetical protein